MCLGPKSKPLTHLAQRDKNFRCLKRNERLYKLISVSTVFIKSVQIRVNNFSWWKSIWLSLISPTKTMTRYHSATTILVCLKIIFKLQIWLVLLLGLTTPQKKNQMSWHPVLQDLISCFWSNLGFHINEWGGGEETGKPSWRVASIQIGEWF